MRITVTARHCEVAEELRARGRALVERVARRSRAADAAEVIFAEDHGVPVVELRLRAGRGAPRVARAEGADHRTALDRAATRLRRQLDKPAPRRRRAGERAGA